MPSQAPAKPASRNPRKVELMVILSGSYFEFHATVKMKSAGAFALERRARNGRQTRAFRPPLPTNASLSLVAIASPVLVLSAGLSFTFIRLGRNLAILRSVRKLRAGGWPVGYQTPFKPVLAEVIGNLDRRRKCKALGELATDDRIDVERGAGRFGARPNRINA